MSNFQGDSADCMYFVEDGEARVAIKNMVSLRLIDERLSHGQLHFFSFLV